MKRNIPNNTNDVDVALALNTSGETDNSGPTLLERVAAGDNAAFEQVVSEYAPLIRFLARKSMAGHSRGDGDVEDVVQEILLALWRAAQHFDRRRGSERTFVVTIAKHRLIDRVRRLACRPRAVDLGEGAPEIADSTDGAHPAGSVGEACLALARVDAHHRHLVELAVLHGKTAREIAQSTGMPVGTVKSTIHRTLKHLRAELADVGLAA
jgi:RNA polymerase sigma-70 factor (ECF subfamily)